jgi:hypothetical protein
MVIAEDGAWRAFDSDTRFQSRHVSPYKDGDWRHLLTKGQKARVKASLGPWLKTNGYA